MSRRAIVVLTAPLMVALAVASAQSQPLQSAGGRVIEAAEGDVVVLPHGAKVSVVTRSQVQARLVYVAAQQTLLLFTDPAPEGTAEVPDAKGFRRWQLQTPWPLEPRWEGTATIDEYLPSIRGPMMLAIHIDRGTILVAPATGRDIPFSPTPLAVVRTTLATGRQASGSFDEIEQTWLAGGDSAFRGPVAGMRLRMQGAGETAAGSSATAPSGALRVGGSIRVPTRIQSAAPIYPQTAKNAGVQGVVILEVTIGEDGAVSDARVLRSIPLLDAAALDAVRQWRYEPTLLNGVARPVIMTATVNFSLAP